MVVVGKTFGGVLDWECNVVVVKYMDAMLGDGAVLCWAAMSKLCVRRVRPYMLM